MKKIDEMSWTELKGECKRHRITLKRIATMSEGFLAQNYQHLAIEALEFENGLRPYPDHQKVDCPRCGKSVKVCVDGSFWEHLNGMGLHCNGVPVDELNTEGDLE